MRAAVIRAAVMRAAVMRAAVIRRGSRVPFVVAAFSEADEIPEAFARMP